MTIDFAERLAPALLQDYQQLRERWYWQRQQVRGMAHDAFDARSIIVLASDGERCLGGVRATVSTPERPQTLPLEALCPPLSLPRFFPELSLERYAYAEFSRLVVEARLGNQIALSLFRFLWLEHNPHPEVAYAFSLAPATSSRLYRALAQAHGLGYLFRPVPPAWLPAELRAKGEFLVQGYILEKGQPPQ